MFTSLLCDDNSRRQTGNARRETGRERKRGDDMKQKAQAAARTLQPRYMIRPLKVYYQDVLLSFFKKQKNTRANIIRNGSVFYNAACKVSTSSLATKVIQYFFQVQNAWNMNVFSGYRLHYNAIFTIAYPFIIEKALVSLPPQGLSNLC